MASKPTLIYLDIRPFGPIGGRGNAVRLFMLANKIPFTDVLQPMDEWQNIEKERYIKDGKHTLGHLPVLEYEGKCMTETIAIARFIARQNDLYGKDAQIDYESDAIADAHQEWRDKMVDALTGSDDDKKQYNDKRRFYLNAMESHYKARSAKDNAYMASGELPGFADTTIFNMIRDDNVANGEISLDEYPNLQEMYKAVGAVPEVRKWIENWEAREV